MMAFFRMFGRQATTPALFVGVLLLLLAGCAARLHTHTPSTAASQPGEPPVPTYHLKRVTNLPTDLSADIDQAPWPGIPDFSPMTLVGTHGQPCPLQTCVKACWDDRAIRIIWRCQYKQVHAVHYGKRDTPLWNDDAAEVLLAPDGDLTRYCEIVINPYGDLFDAAIFNPTIKRDNRYFRFDSSWNCEGIRWKATGPGMYNAADRRDRWWTVEAEIPFAGLGVRAPWPGQSWRAGLFRVEHAAAMPLYTWSAIYDRERGFQQSDRFGIWIFDK